MLRAFFGKTQSERIAEEIIDKSSRMITNAFSLELKSTPAVAAAEKTATATLSAAEKTAAATLESAKATRYAAWIRASASVIGAGAASYAAFSYIKPIEEKIKLIEKENESISKSLNAATTYNQYARNTITLFKKAIQEDTKMITSDPNKTKGNLLDHFTTIYNEQETIAYQNLNLNSGHNSNFSMNSRK